MKLSYSSASGYCLIHAESVVNTPLFLTVSENCMTQQEYRAGSIAILFIFLSF